MIKVEFLGPLKRENLRLECDNLHTLREILQKDESLKEWLSLCAVAVNDELVNDLNFALKNGDNIKLLPPVCGG